MCDAQNMTEVVWQLGRKRSCKTARRVSVRLFSRDRHPRLLSISVTYRLLHGFIDPSPDLSPRRPYQLEPEGRGLIGSEG